MTVELENKIQEALKSDGCIITISHKSDGDRLSHYYYTRNYKKDDLLPSLDHLKGELRSKEIKGIGSTWK